MRERLRVTSRGQAALRCLVLLGPVVALLLTGPAGAWPPVWLAVLVALLAGGHAAYPESPAGTAATLLVLAWWGLGLRDGLQPAAVPAATALLLAHVAALVAAYGPVELVLGAPLLRRWGWRTAALLPVAPLGYLALRAVSGTEPPYVWLLGVTTAFGAVLAGSVWWSLGPVEPR